MRFTVNKDAFLKALNTASHAIDPKNALAALANFKLELDEKGLGVTGSNTRITIRSTVPYKNGDKELIRNSGVGGTLVNARSCLEGVRRMEGSEITLEVIDDSIAKVSDGKTDYKLPCMKAEEYPDLNLEPEGEGLEVPCSDLISLVDATAFAASSKEQARPILTAVNLEAGNGELVATATDSFRLARKSVPITGDAKFTVNVPARLLIDVTHLFETALNVRIYTSADTVLFAFDGTIVSSRLIDGAFPVTKAIIPQGFNYYLEVNANELLAAMGRASVVTAEREPTVTLSMKEDAVEISSKNDLNGSVEESLSTFSFTGEKLSISFNPIYVSDAVKALKSEDVTLCFQSDQRPFVVRDNKNPSVVELMTPLRSH